MGDIGGQICRNAQRDFLLGVQLISIKSVARLLLSCTIASALCGL